jgi:high affinity Mn2+ porin
LTVCPRIFASAILAARGLCWAQDPQVPIDNPSNGFLSHFWISGQANSITQGHPTFASPYSGENSFKPGAEIKSSFVLTLYTGVRLTPWTSVLFDYESAGGRGVSDAFGLAGFTDLDVVRNPTLGAKPYVARIMLHQVIPLGKETVEVEQGPLQIFSRLPARRFEVRAGKMGIVDFFDANAVGSDSHLQFMNWTIDNNGAYDYAADTRGYTYAVVTEYDDRKWSARFAEALMPKVANGLDLQWNLAAARAENVEIEVRRSFLGAHEGTWRVLSYVNHANMGSYREAIDAYLTHHDPVPDITAHGRQGRIKYGFGLNTEQMLGGSVRAYGRFGWNEGHNESWAYTEVNESISGGADMSGGAWRRKNDRTGAAFVANALSGDHRRYLELGGKGFLLGDGALNYGREKILEYYYDAHLFKGVNLAFDLQRIWDPGYNRDRGPVFVAAVRLHLEGVLLRPHGAGPKH